ncbi:hypothetical protein F2P56_010547 [Juglans regia]|uniref:Uncharacterized protein n=2 Tax=Juglans regia TaxID=51240 RepID=A0A833XQN0_JUGRE|nr:UPF0481 protein At3g47200-like [Juglans regia]KAF5469993.1 hypothetical protein F2P56_010547 [Juglans regia]
MACRVASRVSEKDIECEEYLIDIPPDLEPAEWPECCIYRVPKRLRNVNKEAYTPNLVSIGPLHHGKKELREMEKQKERYLKDFCYRTKKNRKDLALIIEKKEANIRHCYAEPSRLGSREFVNMILMDGIFIIELFLRTFERKSDYILSKPWLRNSIQHDLILLENQLPFFVLEDLYTSISSNHKEVNPNKEDTPFLQLSRNYFSHYDPKTEPNIGEEVKHFTDLLRYFFFRPDLRSKKGGNESERIDHLYCATKLDEAGVQFEAVKKRHLTDIQFDKGNCLEHCPYLNCSWLLNCLPCLKCLVCLKSMQPFLELPALIVDDTTEIVFRNLMALEQCHYPTRAYICNYILLLDYLINTEKDVDLLVEKKVIVNQLGSDEAVATLVNKLGHQIVEVNSCHYKLSQKLNEHYEDFWNRNMATLTTVYFRDIWRGTATVVGIVILFLTVWNIFLRHFVKMPRT